MAGHELINMMTERGGTPSDYSDVVFGTVLKAKPLEVKLANDLILTEDFLITGKHIGKFKVSGNAIMKGSAEMSFHGHSGTANISKADLSFKKTSMYIEIDNSLEAQDKIMMIRLDGGQKYYILERIDKDEYGF